MDQLIQIGILTEEASAFLRVCVESGIRVLIGGNGVAVSALLEIAYNYDTDADLPQPVELESTADDTDISHYQLYVLVTLYDDGSQKVATISEIQADGTKLPIFERVHRRTETEEVVGQLRPTGLPPSFLDKIDEANLTLLPGVFAFRPAQPPQQAEKKEDPPPGPVPMQPVLPPEPDTSENLYEEADESGLEFGDDFDDYDYDAPIDLDFDDDLLEEEETEKKTNPIRALWDKIRGKDEENPPEEEERAEPRRRKESAKADENDDVLNVEGESGEQTEVRDVTDVTDDSEPDFDSMSPEEMMAWMESLAKRQGATEGLTTGADVDIAEADPDSMDMNSISEYIPHGWTRESWEAHLAEEATDTTVTPSPDLGIKDLSQEEPEIVNEDTTAVPAEPPMWLMEDVKATELESKPVGEDVQFTVFHPQEATAEQWYTLLLYTHIAEVIPKVRQDAEKFTDEMTDSVREVTARKFTKLVRGTELRLVPQAEGVTFNPEMLTIRWQEDYERARFRFQASTDIIGQPCFGEISVFVGVLEVATIRFSIFITEESIPQAQVTQASAVANLYQKIFVSYSHKDTEIVTACKSAFEAIGYTVAIDYEDLRTGEVWSEGLERLIDDADIFQLFWSNYSAQSSHCRRKWEYALQKKRESFIRPVYWQQPLPDVPDTLGHIHFKFMPDLAK